VTRAEEIEEEGGGGKEKKERAEEEEEQECEKWGLNCQNRKGRGEGMREKRNVWEHDA
jgi:hypothetical protein